MQAPLVFQPDQAFVDNPYPQYQAMLAADAPYWMANGPQAPTPGVWLFSRYQDVQALLRMSHDDVAKQITRVKPQAQLSPLDLTLLNLDPPAHTRLRALCATAFSAQQVQAMEPEIDRHIDALIDAMLERGQADFMADFAIQLPVAIICGIMGVNLADRHQLLGWAARIVAGSDSTAQPPEVVQDQRLAFASLLGYFGELIAQRRRQPGPDLVSQLMAAQDGPDALAADLVRNTCAFLLMTGYETMVSSLGNGLYSLLRHPEQLVLLRQNPALLPSAVEEMLRFESPLQRSTFRIVARECTLGGQTLQAGDQVGAVIGAANRDPREFTEPDRFLIDRKPNRHLAFGSGIHVCLGALLARTELRLAFARLLHRLPRVELDGTPAWKPNTLVRALQHLPVRLA